MARRDFENSDFASLRRFLQHGVILVDGDSEGGVSIDDADPVFVAVVVNVTGYGPHPGAIYAIQNRFHGNPDAALQPAFEILEAWELDHNPDYYRELESEYGDDAMDVFTETFDGLGWKLSADDFARAVEGTDAAKYIPVHEPEE